MKRKLTQEELAKIADISYVTITKIERGAVNNPRLWTLMKTAKALGVSLDRLTSVEQISNSGYKVIQEPRQYFWGPEAFVEDPDGYILALIN